MFDFTHFGLGLGGGLVSDPTKLDLISKNLGETTARGIEFCTKFDIIFLQIG